MYGMKYPAKEAYQNDSVKKYDEVRFTSIKGKLLDRFEKKSITVPLNKYARKGDRIIDIPVGTGRIAEVLLENGYRVMGADISEQMLTLAKIKCSRYGDNFEVKIEDAEKLSFENNTFDYASSVRLFGHLPLDIKVRILSELLRVSNNGVFVTVYIDNIFQRIKRNIKNFIKPNNAPWYPMKYKDCYKLIEQCNGEILDKKSVVPFFSEGVTFYIKRKK